MGLNIKIRLLLCLLFISLITCYAGRLDDFEEAATKPRPKPHTHSSGNSDYDPFDSDDDDAEWDAAIFEAIASTFIYGGRHSHLRMQGYSGDPDDSSESGDMWEFHAERRKYGEPTLPIVKLEQGYWYDSSDLYANTTRFELGYGCIAFLASNSYFRESNPTDEMTLFTWHMVYRMTFSEHFEVGMGLGEASLKGNNENTGSSFTLPIRVHTSDNWGIEFKPEWININGNRVVDYDVGLYYNFDRGSVIAGYRMLGTKFSTIQGPYIGVALRF